MSKRPHKPKTLPPRGPVVVPLASFLQAPPAAVAQRERSWTVPVADELLEEFHGSPSAQAAELRTKAEAFEEGPEAALAIADEMERRARAGVRHWPGSDAARKAAGHRAELQHTIEGRQTPAPDDVDPPAPEEVS